MNIYPRKVVLALTALFCGVCALTFGQSAIAEAPRVVALGGPVTETVYALGAGDWLVGTDTSSVYPAAATKLPQVGYQRTLAAEGVLSLRPTLIIATDEAGPPPVIEQLKAAGVRLALVPSEHSVAGAIAKVKAIAAALGREAEGEKLVATITKEAEETRVYVESLKARPKVLFLYARGGSTLSVSGTNTAADAMIQLAGAQNAVTEYANYKPLTDEAAASAAPDFILTLDGGLASVGGKAKLLEHPGLALTPAGQNQRVVALDDLYLLGFGPRIGAAIRDLARQLHPQK